ncbi:MAG: hypothetical protein IT168_08915 [Bryobacterales bacterium]|nr:hypothetical protein [Bryobacterales bacterium]
MQFLLLFLFAAIAAAQEEHRHQHEQMAHQHGASETKDPTQDFLLSQSSGTAFQAKAWPMPMKMTQAGGWNLMWMGQAFVVATQQSGPRGGDKVYSANWGMLGAVHSLAGGSFMVRAMVSLDPLTVTKRRYPLLFQTGESAYGTPLVDAQHPHDLLMELSVQYARRLTQQTIWNVYYAPVGDAPLGPVAFPHRASAMELPQATLAHHWQDSTHIANNVLTAGVSWNNKIRVEGSGFRGQEPNENRWNIDMGKMDSWSTRLTVSPTDRWTAQVSGGRIKRPEQFHADDVVRLTASVHHVVPRPGRNYWATSLIWARNYKTVGQYGTHAVTAETVYPVTRRNFVTGRFEWSQRDELFEYNHDLSHEITERTGKRAFNVAAYTAGYTRDVPVSNTVQTGIGINLTAYSIANDLQPYYGKRPYGLNVFLRFRLNPSE